ncbi:hypothetical protein NDU88_004869 [Pleurodeles waltl]|uniref:Uncharacterized protein n=1 Tax=Pleurodeles waltl TaxID=8319 RepID=A0AAV7TAY6_PLEWA|nr:hypothetical protein NDU88_004869 [Pleurodeles waltl]
MLINAENNCARYALHAERNNAKLNQNRLAPRGKIYLQVHSADDQSATDGSWNSGTLNATPKIQEHCRDRGRLLRRFTIKRGSLLTSSRRKMVKKS